MGFYMRPDASPHNTWSHPDAINSSAPAYLVRTMCDKWRCLHSGYDGSPDYIYFSAFEKANEAIPWTLERYLKWDKENGSRLTRSNGIAESWGKPIDQEMFDHARDFIKKCVINQWDAYGC